MIVNKELKNMYETKKNVHKATSYTLRNDDEIPEAEDTLGRSSTESDVDDIQEALDGGLGWVVTLSTFMHHFLMDGFCYNFGTFVADFLMYFGDSNAKTQLLNSTINGVYHCMGPVSGGLMTKVGCRRLTITGVIVASVGLFLSTFSPNLDVMILLYGVVGGVGFGLVHTPSVVIVGQYFNKHRALATGIAVCGSGIGGFVFAPLSVLLIETYGWKGALWILSAIILNGAIFAASYRTPPRYRKPMFVSSTGTKVSQEKYNFRYKHLFIVFKQTFNFSLLLSPTFALYSFCGILVGIGFYIPFNFLPIFASDLNLSASDGALLLSIMGIFNTVSRILIGLLSDQSWADSIIINSMLLLIGGIATCFVPLYNTYAILMTYSAVFGTTVGSFVVLRSVILVELKGEKILSNTFGLFNAMLGISIFIGSPIAGALSDLTESYGAAFYFCGGTIGLAGLLCFPLRRIARWEHGRHSHQDGTAEPQLTSMQILHI